MSDDIQFNSRVGNDGVLNVQISLGQNEANRDVLVTVQSIKEVGPVKKQDSQSWPELLQQTYGSCAVLDLKREP